MIWLTESERDYLVNLVQNDKNDTLYYTRFLEGNSLKWKEDKIKFQDRMVSKLDEAEVIHEPETS